MKKIIGLLLLALTLSYAKADVKLPKIFGENMVLQRNKPIRIWGWVSVNEKVTVNFDKQTKITKADKSGKWEVMLSPEIAGGPYKLLVKGKNQISIDNVLVGEVWICSGQSNMQMPVEGWGKVLNYQQEIANADYPFIRQFGVPNTFSPVLKDDLDDGDWKICSKSTAGEFSAVAYFYARELYNQLKIPVGLINTSWGGTISEIWTSRKGFEQSDEFKDIAADMKSNDLTTMLKKRKVSVLKDIEKTHGSLDHNPDVKTWNYIDFDDSKWPKIRVPGLWENESFRGLDGIVRYRKTFILNENQAAQSAVLELAKIDDHDVTYLNGIKIGETNEYQIDRRYKIPAGILKAGKNVIALKIQNSGGGGGIYGETSNVQLTLGEKKIAMAGDWPYMIESVIDVANTIDPNDYPSLLFNAMINPLLPYTIRGAIWYQGESNAERAYQYRTAFPLMINDWRQQWKQGDFPFFFVQLASFGSKDENSNVGSSWSELREAQAMALSLPNTGMSVTTDIGNAQDVHPKNKQEVGRRLAKIALHDVYEIPGEFTGPVYQSMKTEGNHIELTFIHLGSGWLIKDKYGYINGFEIAGADKKFYYAKATLVGDKISVFNENVANPVAVRYNWADDASDGNLYNKELFPAGPFRTDNWDGITVKTRYSFLK